MLVPNVSIHKTHTKNYLATTALYNGNISKVYNGHMKSNNQYIKNKTNIRAGARVKL